MENGFRSNQDNQNLSAQSRTENAQPVQCNPDMAVLIAHIREISITLENGCRVLRSNTASTVPVIRSNGVQYRIPKTIYEHAFGETSAKIHRSCGNEACFELTHLTLEKRAGIPEEVFFTRIRKRVEGEEWDGKRPDCWVWIGDFSGSGYPRFSIRGQEIPAHCFSWEYHNQQEVPAGLEISHLCCDPRCVNPAHLIAETHAANMLRRSLDGNASIRYRHGETHGSTKIEDKDIRLMFFLHEELKYSNAAIARTIGCHKSYVGHILNGRDDRSIRIVYPCPNFWAGIMCPCEECMPKGSKYRHIEIYRRRDKTSPIGVADEGGSNV